MAQTLGASGELASYGDRCSMATSLSLTGPRMRRLAVSISPGTWKSTTPSSKSTLSHVNCKMASWRAPVYRPIRMNIAR